MAGRSWRAASLTGGGGGPPLRRGGARAGGSASGEWCSCDEDCRAAASSHMDTGLEIAPVVLSRMSKRLDRETGVAPGLEAAGEIRRPLEPERLQRGRRQARLVAAVAHH